MSKIDINKVAEILKKNQLDPALLRRVVEEMNLVVQPESDGPAAPKSKSQFVVLSPEGGKVAWVIQIEEDAAPAAAVARIKKAADEYNNSKKGRLYPVLTVGEALESVPRRFFKLDDGKLLVKTKTPVEVVTVANKL
jgi:hypothetical protein